MQKRAQFYIIAAIVIVVVVAGLVGVATYAVVKQSPQTFQTLSSDLKQEGPRVIDYGIYSGENITELLNNFTDTEFAPYFLKKTDKANVVFVYGNKSDLYAVQYNTTSTGTISSSIGSGIFQWNSVRNYAERMKIIVNPGDKEVNISIVGKIYSFELKEGEMFYFLMVQKQEDEQYVERN
jgi:hypothetical protein